MLATFFLFLIKTFLVVVMFVSFIFILTSIIFLAKTLFCNDKGRIFSLLKDNKLQILASAGSLVIFPLVIYLAIYLINIL